MGEQTGLKVSGLEGKREREGIHDIVFGVDYTVGCEHPARGVHTQSEGVWSAFSAWSNTAISEAAFLSQLEGLGIRVTPKARHMIARDSQLNFQQLLFALNEATPDERQCMGAPTRPGVDIKGHARPTHHGQVAVGAFQRQRSDDLTSIIVPNFRPSKSNNCSSANPLATDYANSFSAVE